MAATACCYLGLLTAWLLWLLPMVLTWVEPGSQISGRGLNPGLFVSRAVDRSLPWFLFQNAGPLVLTLGFVTAGIPICRKLRHWSRLFLAFAVFWAALLLLDATLVFAQGFSGPLTRLLQLAALADFAEPILGISLAVAVAAFVIAATARIIKLLHLDDLEDPKSRIVCALLLFVVPVAVLNWHQGGAQPVGSGFWRLGLPYAPTLFATLAVVASLWKFRPEATPLRLGGLGAVAAVCLATAAYAGVDYFSIIEPRQQAEAHFDEHQSRYWDLRFEQGAFTPGQRQQWGAEADQRLEDLAARRITCEERHYTLSEIFALDGEYRSPIVTDVLGGAWVKFELTTIEPSKRAPTLRDLYQSSPNSILGEPDAKQERAWETYINSLPCPDRPEPHITLHHNHRGITFTHEFRNGWGYGSDMAGKQLQRIRGLGGTAIALVPYASFRTPPSTEFRFLLSESDERVVRSIDQAHAAGLQIMLKPQLWGRIFTGDIKYERTEDFGVWSRRYRRWILHFARMAELHGVELFCIGNELNGVSGHEQHWRALIQDVRRIYSGPLTFAANWNEEFEQISFWDELDYLGVNFYFPLAERGEIPTAGSPRLQELTANLEAMHRRYRKPILFTEVGYPPLATAAAEPWKETKAAFDHDLQKHCYETVFQAFSGKPWFAGMYWWKWPSHGQGPAFSIGHNPIGKPALDVLRDWYGRPSPATQWGATGSAP